MACYIHYHTQTCEKCEEVENGRGGKTRIRRSSCKREDETFQGRNRRREREKLGSNMRREDVIYARKEEMRDDTK